MLFDEKRASYEHAKTKAFPPLMFHIFKFQVVYPIHNIGTHLRKDFFTHFMLILMIFHIFLNLDFVHSKKPHMFKDTLKVFDDFKNKQKSV